jgi:hypothetical protein
MTSVMRVSHQIMPAAHSQANVSRGSHFLLSLLFISLSSRACTCEVDRGGNEYPGPDQAGLHGPSKGRGAPQIDVLGYLSQAQDLGVVSQGMRFAPYTADQTVTGGTSIQDAADARENPFPGNAKCVILVSFFVIFRLTSEPFSFPFSILNFYLTTKIFWMETVFLARQFISGQVISALTNVPAGSYTEGGAQFTAFGYEHTVSVDNPALASLHWSRGTTEVFRVTGEALAAPADASIFQRLISEEPMVSFMIRKSLLVIECASSIL